MGKSVGKIFEANWKKSIPESVFFYRPPDAAQSFGGNNNLRFSAKSPCDLFMFTGEKFYALELKSVGSKFMSFERRKEDNGIIHFHQIENLTKYSKYKNVVSGFILDFRESDKTYFCKIEDFNYMIESLDKKSFNESDLMKYAKPIVIEKVKKKVNYKYNIEKLIMDTKNII